MGPLRRIAVVVAVSVAVLPAAASAHSCPGADQLPSVQGAAHARAATLCLLNERREARGLRALHQNWRLARAALRHSRDMVHHVYFAHDSRSGRRFDARIRATGYLSGARAWTVGENLAWGSQQLATPRMIVAAWMASPPHRRNILDGRFTDIGVAIVGGAPVRGRPDVAATYTTDFGHRG